MATFTINPTAVTANVEKDSPSSTLPAGTSSVTVQLTDSAGNSTPAGNSNWTHTTGNIKQWGVQRSTDGGSTWNWGPVFQGDANDSTKWVPFGSLGRDGKLPRLLISGDSLVAASGDRLRLAILTDTNLTLGAVITTA